MGDKFCRYLTGTTRAHRLAFKSERRNLHKFGVFLRVLATYTINPFFFLARRDFNHASRLSPDFVLLSLFFSSHKNTFRHILEQQPSETQSWHEKAHNYWGFSNNCEPVKVAPAAGFEPATNWLTDACLNHINQGQNAFIYLYFCRLCLYLCFSLLLSPYSVKLLNRVTDG